MSEMWVSTSGDICECTHYCIERVLTPYIWHQDTPFREEKDEGMDGRLGSNL